MINHSTVTSQLMAMIVLNNIVAHTPSDVCERRGRISRELAGARGFTACLHPCFPDPVCCFSFLKCCRHICKEFLPVLKDLDPLRGTNAPTCNAGRMMMGESRTGLQVSQLSRVQREPWGRWMHIAAKSTKKNAEMLRNLVAKNSMWKR